MKLPTYEAAIPDGYTQVKYLNAKEKKTGLVLTVVSFVIMAAVLLVAILPLKAVGFSMTDSIRELGSGGLLILYAPFIVSLLAYIVLHELVHGAVYKLLTGQKLTFGISWSCAFCGVPSIWVYRKTALLAVAAPLTLFSVILIPLSVLLFFFNPLYYLASILILGLHLGGCCGDLYVILLLAFRYKDPRTLMRDTGPEQFFYLPQA